MLNIFGKSHPVKNNINKYLWVLTKIIILILTYGYISYELSHKHNLNNIIESFKENFLPENIIFILIAVLLIPINLSIEAFKWRFLIRKLESISYNTSLKAVLSGITLSIFTPNRIGEIASRVFVLQRKNRTKGIYLSAIGNMATLVITIIIGLFSCLVYLLIYTPEKFLEGNRIYYYGIPIIIYSIALILIFFNLSKTIKLLSRLKFLHKFRDTISILASYNNTEIFRILLISLLRYCTYSSQFLLLLIFFNVNIQVPIAYLGIALTYFFISFIPSFTLAEIGIRDSVSIFFIGYFSDNTIGILSAASLIWIINLVIPALIGSVLLYKIKF